MARRRCVLGYALIRSILYCFLAEKDYNRGFLWATPPNDSVKPKLKCPLFSKAVMSPWERRVPRGSGDGPCRGSGSPGRGEATASGAVPPVGSGGTKAAPTRAGRLRTASRHGDGLGRQADGPVPPTPAGTGVAAGKMPWRSRRDRARLRAWTGDRAQSGHGMALAGGRRPRALSLRRRARRLAAPGTRSSRDGPGPACSAA